MGTKLIYSLKGIKSDASSAMDYIGNNIYVCICYFCFGVA